MAEQKKTFGFNKSALIGLVASVIVSALMWTGALDKNEMFLVDQRYVYRPAVSVDTTVMTIDVDDGAIDKIGRWPWTWDRYAVILDMMRLYGGAQVAFVEPYFSEPGPVTVQRDDARRIAMGLSQFAQGTAGPDITAEIEAGIPDFNERFLRAVRRFPRTFIGSSFSIPEGDAARDEKLVRRLVESYKPHYSRDKRMAIASLDTFSMGWPKPGSLMLASDIVPVTSRLSAVSSGAGFTRIIQDNDGIVRRTPLLVWYDGRAYPSIALSMAARMLDCPTDLIRIDLGRHIEIPGRERTVRIPIDASGNMMINWVGRYHETFYHLPYNVIAYHYAHRLAKQYVRQFIPGQDNPQDVVQKLGEFMMRQKLVPPDAVQEITTQYYFIWIMDYFLERGAPYDVFLRSTATEDNAVIRSWWDQMAVNRRTEEVIRSGQPPDYSAVVFSLDIKDTTGLYRDGFDQTAFFFRNGRINEVRPLWFLEPSEIDVSGVTMRFSPMDLAGRTVFVGLTATGLNAFNPIPYQRRYQMFGMLPNIYNTIITGKFLREQPAWAGHLYVLAYALTVTWLIMRFRPLMGFAIVAGASALHASLAWLIFILGGVLIPIVAPVLTIILGYAVGNLYRYVEEARERQKVRGLFGAMVSPDVLRMMETDPDKFRLSGEKYEATMFSSDVSGFTTISEGVTAQELADILNIYLTPMSNIIMTFDGFCDKYEGDAIKADFGVPISDPQNAWKGCFAALLQQEEIRVIQRLILLKYGVKITARMGVNTGVVSAGNMGSEKKMQYTVMGEAVTIAEELEPINKLYETWIAIGPNTYAQAKDRIEIRHLDRVLMGPARHPLDVYELMGWRRDKFMEYWRGRPVPPLIVEGWRKLTPEKILGYLHYWDEKKFSDSPFYRDLRKTFEDMAVHSLECIRFTDIAAVAEIRLQMDELDKAVRSHEKILADMKLDSVSQSEVDELRRTREKAAEPWRQKLWDWKLSLKQRQFEVQYLSGRIPDAEFEELLRLVDTYQKRVECYTKRCTFPKPEDTVAYGIAENLWGLLAGDAFPMKPPAARAKAEEAMRSIRARMEKFIGAISKRADEYHEFIADHCLVPEVKFRVRDAFAAARKPYIERRWDDAERAMRAVLEIDPTDGPAIKYIERIAHLRKSPPPEDWNGDWAEE